MAAETAYCYHCGKHHPIGEMRQIVTKTGKRWRCIKSIEATKVRGNPGCIRQESHGNQPG